MMNKEKKQKKGLAVIYDPHNLYQFAWYHSKYGENIKWDALCLPNGYKGEYMSEYCERSQLFDKIYRGEQDFLSLSLLLKVLIFLEFLIYALLHKQKKMCRKIINKYIPDISEYDNAVVLTDIGIVSGAVIAMGDQMDVVILEDGMADYMERKKPRFIQRYIDINDCIGCWIARMGYANPQRRYNLNTTRQCMKFSTHPDWMPYDEYREHGILFESTAEIAKKWQRVINNIYPQLSNLNFQEYDAIVFTTPLRDCVHDSKKYVKRFIEFVKKDGVSSVIIKKHPRDEDIYDFGTVKTVNISNEVPSEALLPFVKGKMSYFMYPSSTLLCMTNRHEYPCRFVYFRGLYEESSLQKVFYPYISREEMDGMIVKYYGEKVTLDEI